MSIPRPATPFTRIHWAELLFYALFGVLAVFGVRTFALRGALLDPAEGAHLYQAHAFADGLLARQPGGAAPLTRYPHLVEDAERGRYSRFPPGHAAWLAPGIAAHHPRAMAALATALTLAGVYTLGWRLRLPRHLLPLLTLAGPFFLWVHATALPETTGMMLATGLLLFYVKGRQETRNLSLAIAACCWSGLLLVSPAIALCLALAFGIDLWCVLSRNLRSPSHWRGTVLMLLIASLGVRILLGYSHAQTGHTSVSPSEVYEPSEGWGFGLRRTQGGAAEPVPHSLRRGFANLVAQLRQGDAWLLGGFPGFLLIWLALCAHGWSRRWSGLLLGALLVVALAHIGYWDPGLGPAGPLHYAETLPFLLAAGGLGLSRIWRKLAPRRPLRLILFGSMGGLLLYFALPFHLDLLFQTRRHTRTIGQFQAFANTASPPLLLFLPDQAPIQGPTLSTLALNPRGRESRILALRAPKEERDALAVAFSERTAVSFTPETGRTLPHRGTFEGRHRVAANSHHSRNTGENRDTARIVESDRHDAGFLFYGWYPFLPPGEYECRFSLRWSGVAEERPLRLEVMSQDGHKILASKTLSAGLEEAALRFTLDDVTRVEPRVYYGGSGEAVLRAVDLAPIALPASDAVAEPVP